MRFLYAAALSLLLALAMQGQTPTPSPCTIKAADLPALRGFKLEQPLEAYQTRFPGLVARHYVAPDDRGLLTDHLSRIDFYDRDLRERQAEFEGVDTIEVQFLDDKLVSLKIDYDSSTKWENSREFTATIAKTLNLPSTGWRGRQEYAELECADFKVVTTTDILGKGELMITKSDLDQVLVQRRKDIEEKKRRAFKP